MSGQSGSAGTIERFDRIMEQVGSGTGPHDMTVRLTVGNDESLVLGLKDLGQTVTVEVRASNQGMINLLQSQRDVIISHLEGKDISANIVIDPNASGTPEKRDRRETRQRTSGRSRKSRRGVRRVARNIRVKEGTMATGTSSVTAASGASTAASSTGSNSGPDKQRRIPSDFDRPAAEPGSAQSHRSESICHGAGPDDAGAVASEHANISFEPVEQPRQRVHESMGFGRGRLYAGKRHVHIARGRGGRLPERELQPDNAEPDRINRTEAANR